MPPGTSPWARSAAAPSRSASATKRSTAPTNGAILDIPNEIIGVSETSGDDLIEGGFGLDTLRGGAGSDTMIGGAAADFYEVDSLDEVYEQAGGGVDYIWTDGDYALLRDQKVEVLSLCNWTNQLAAVTCAAIDGSIETFEFRAQAKSFASIFGDTPNADLTGNEIDQLIVVETGAGDIISHRNIGEGMAGADTILGDNEADVAQ